MSLGHEIDNHHAKLFHHGTPVNVFRVSVRNVPSTQHLVHHRLPVLDRLLDSERRYAQVPTKRNSPSASGSGTQPILYSSKFPHF